MGLTDKGVFHKWFYSSEVQNKKGEKFVSRETCRKCLKITYLQTQTGKKGPAEWRGRGGTGGNVKVPRLGSPFLFLAGRSFFLSRAHPQNGGISKVYRVWVLRDSGSFHLENVATGVSCLHQEQLLRLLCSAEARLCAPSAACRVAAWVSGDWSTAPRLLPSRVPLCSAQEERPKAHIPISSVSLPSGKFQRCI